MGLRVRLAELRLGAAASPAPPAIDSSARTGTFTCRFPNGPAASTVSVAVGDGASSNVLTQAAHRGERRADRELHGRPADGRSRAKTKTFAFAVSDPGVSDTFAPATGYPSCGAGGVVRRGLAGGHRATTAAQTGQLRVLLPAAGPPPPSRSRSPTRTAPPSAPATSGS